MKLTDDNLWGENVVWQKTLFLVEGAIRGISAFDRLPVGKGD